MTLKQFFDTYNYKYVEAGGSENALNQCVDLVNQYIAEVLEQPKILWTNAIDFYKKAGDAYEWIVNTPEAIPSPGDIVIWGTWAGAYGHIAIIKEADINKFTSFDQNWPLGSVSHFVTHTYNGVLGWLHFKQSMPTNQDLITDSNNWKFLMQKYDVSDPSQIVGKIEEYEGKIASLTKQLADAQKQLSEKQTELDVASKVVTEMEKISKAYGVSTFDGVDKIIRTLKEEVAATQNGSPVDEVPKPIDDTTSGDVTIVVKKGLVEKILDFIKNWFTIKQN